MVNISFRDYLDFTNCPIRFFNNIQYSETLNNSIKLKQISNDIIKKIVKQIIVQWFNSDLNLITFKKYIMQKYDDDNLLHILTTTILSIKPNILQKKLKDVQKQFKILKQIIKDLLNVINKYFDKKILSIIDNNIEFKKNINNKYYYNDTIDIVVYNNMTNKHVLIMFIVSDIKINKFNDSYKSKMILGKQYYMDKNSLNVGEIDTQYLIIKRRRIVPKIQNVNKSKFRFKTITVPSKKIKMSKGIEYFNKTFVDKIDDNIENLEIIKKYGFKELKGIMCDKCIYGKTCQKN